MANLALSKSGFESSGSAFVAEQSPFSIPWNGSLKNESQGRLSIQDLLDLRTFNRDLPQPPRRMRSQPQARPHLQAVVADIPDQTISEGDSFTSINLDDYVADATYADAEIVWTFSGNTELTVTITDRIATIGIPNPDWNGAETITFTATPPDGLSDENAATFTVTPLNDAPNDIFLSGAAVSENEPANTFVAALSSSDPDVGDTFTYSLVSGLGSDDNDSFAIIGTELLTNAVFDFETRNSYTIRIRSADQEGLWFEKQFNIAIADINEAPTDIFLSGTSVAENSIIFTWIASLTNNDPDTGDVFTYYTLVSGPGSTDNASFIIAGTSLLTSAVFDFETQNIYSIRVRCTDQAGLWFEKVFVISVTDVNEAPTDITLSGASVAENAPVNTVVGAFSSADPDANNTFTYSLVSGTGSGDNASFNIAGTNLRTSSVFNYEIQNSYSIRIRSTDQNGLWFEKQFAISITFLDTEIPVVIWVSPINEVDKYYYLGKGTYQIRLYVTATDNTSVSYVKFYRWDAISNVFIDIGVVTSSPYVWDLDTSILRYGWNEIDVQAYDAAGNVSIRKVIFLHRKTYLHLPNVTSN